MTRRGLFKTLFGGIFAALGWNRIKTRRSWRCIAEFRCATKPANADWEVAIFHVRHTQERLSTKMSNLEDYAGHWQWIDHSKNEKA